MKIVVPYGMVVVEEALAVMREVAQVTSPRDDSQEALLAEARDANAVLAGPSTCLDRKLIESAAGLRHIARNGVGVDSIDLRAATERGIFVMNNPELTTDSVSEFTVALLLGLAKNIPRCDRAVKEGQWYEKNDLIHGALAADVVVVADDVILGIGGVHVNFADMVLLNLFLVDIR